MMKAWQIGGPSIASPMYVPREPRPKMCCLCINRLKCAGNWSQGPFCLFINRVCIVDKEQHEVSLILVHNHTYLVSAGAFRSTKTVPTAQTAVNVPAVYHGLFAMVVTNNSKMILLQRNQCPCQTRPPSRAHPPFALAPFPIRKMGAGCVQLRPIGAWTGSC